MTEEEYADFTEWLKNYDMSQAEFIRQAITRATIRPIVTVSPVNDELLSAVGKLTAEYGKIGGNLNQIARSLNEYGTPYNALSVEVRAAISDLAALKFEVLRKVGADLEKARKKRAEWDAKVKDLERRYREEENSEIHEMVHAANLNPEQLSELLRMFAADMAPKPDTINTMNEEETQNEI